MAADPRVLIASANLRDLGGLATSDGQQVAIYTAAERKLARVLEGQVGEVVAIHRANNDSLVASGNAAGQLRFWNLADGEDRFTLQASGQPISDIVFHADNVRVTSSHRDGMVHLWKLPGASVPMDGHTAGITALAFRPDGQQLAVASADRTIRIFDVATGKEEQVVENHADWVVAVAWSPDGSKIASASRDKTAKVFDISNGDLLVTYRGHSSPIGGVAFHPDGKEVYSSGADLIHRWQISDGAKQAEVAVGDVRLRLKAHRLSPAREGEKREPDGVEVQYDLFSGTSTIELDLRGYRAEDALLKVEADEPLPFVSFGDSDNAGALGQLLGEAGVAAAAAAGTDDRESDRGAHAVHTPGALGLLDAGEGRFTPPAKGTVK